jgi:hypothetical protein
VIPRIIHRAYLGGEEPEWTRPFAESWREHHPDWEIVHWDDDLVSTINLSNGWLYEHAEEVTDSVGQLRADILRYEILHRYGGVWVDTDMECLKPIDDLLGVPAFFAWEEQDRWVGNSIIGSGSQHPFIWRLIFRLRENVLRHGGKRPNFLSGPRYVTEQYRLWVAHPHDGVRGFPHVRVYPKDLFYPYLYTELHRGHEDYPDAYTVHHWANQRRKQGKPL